MREGEAAPLRSTGRWEGRGQQLFSPFSNQQPKFAYCHQPELLGLQQKGFKLDKQRPTKLSFSGWLKGMVAVGCLSSSIPGMNEMSGSGRERGDMKGRGSKRERQGVSSQVPHLGEGLGQMLRAEVGKEFVRGVVGTRAGQQGNGMRRLSSGGASVCGKWGERPFSGRRG